jgi:2-polyprenyl-3-methyl-5-hydroxy-6-metoxy-1,4-benzoquinol methylase
MMPRAKALAATITEKALRILRKIKPVRERVTLGEFDDRVEREHLARYRFACRYCEGKTVADMACGTGYGSEALRAAAASVVSYDREPLCGNRILDFDRQSWPEKYDVIVSFETIEHLENPDFFLRNVHASCGLFVVSSPIGEMRGYNPHHKQVWTLEEFQAKVERWFECKYFAQKDEVISDRPGFRCRFVVAVCKPKREAIP